MTSHLVAYTNHIVIEPVVSDKIEAISSTEHVIEGKCISSAVEAIAVGAIVIVSAPESLWVGNLVICPESGILATRCQGN